ncbi:alginate O-acetyltransferase AlgX-related protein [Spirochaeta isovalerica]|uniref:Alginate O-acetyltransferase complex protein AlgJ n=1 Tax=Spirochaeta isovalerica TaxID=150 RepID=A0A841RFK4_9SPIO|nr:hypothetical protein [Spirochaeta isovalerica]MBB6482376.1 alginate O-acetyltransferase complex protein AlgJ [Spirochaeta isovalerica]
MIRLKKTAVALLAILSLAFLLYPGVEGLTDLEDFSIKEKKELIDGRFISEMTSRFEKSISLQNRALSFWSGIKYRFFKEGNRGVLIGREDWLFTSEEFDEDLNPETTYDDFFGEIEKAKTFFDNEGLELVIVPIPNKSRIYREKSQLYSFSSPLENRYDDALARFRNLGIPAADLREPFQKTSLKEKVFFQYDTHWTEAASAAAAREISSLVMPYIEKYGLSRRSFYISEAEYQPFKGDLLAFVPPLENKEERYRKTILADAAPPSLGLFDDPEIPLLLVGTSYSFDSRWNFESELKLALQLDILNLAKEGVGPLEPMRELIKSGYFRETGSSIIIWEIPERYIPLRK